MTFGLCSFGRKRRSPSGHGMVVHACPNPAQDPMDTFGQGIKGKLLCAGCAAETIRKRLAQQGYRRTYDQRRRGVAVAPVHIGPITAKSAMTPGPHDRLAIAHVSSIPFRPPQGPIPALPKTPMPLAKPGSQNRLDLSSSEVEGTDDDSQMMPSTEITRPSPCGVVPRSAASSATLVTHQQSKGTHMHPQPPALPAVPVPLKRPPPPTPAKGEAVVGSPLKTRKLQPSEPVSNTLLVLCDIPCTVNV